MPKTTTTRKTTTEKTAAPKATKAAKAAKQPKAKATKMRDGKLSALDAAARVLAGSKEPLNTKAMIEHMAAQRL